MSFILDALKKSESDRQRQSGPSLFEVKVAPPRRALPIWAVAIAVLLGINVIVISWMLLRHPAARQPAAAAAGETGASAASGGRAAVQDAAAAAPRVAASPPAGSSNSAPAAGAASPAPAARSAPPVAPGAGATQPSSTATPPAATAAAAESGADQSAGQPAAGDNPADYAPAVEPPGGSGSGASAVGAELPIYQQIVTSDGLPPLHLDLHVFAERPRDRFVMINMHRLGEGDSLPNGVQVEAIRTDGVVLSYHGTRFLLPRN